MRKTIAFVKNQTFGGGDRYYEQVKKELSHIYNIKEYFPNPFSKITNINKIRSLFQYIKYVYLYLPKYYKELGKLISNNRDIEAAVIFQDAYRKCPDIFTTLTKKHIYILHEPPREFYEPIYLHAPSLKDYIFTVIFRSFIKLSDYKNTQKAQTIISNSEFSRKKILKIYKRNSIVIYPGFTQLSNTVKPNRKSQCISVGSLLPYKGHELLIESVGLISHNRPSVVLVGNGSQADKNRLITLARACRVKLNIYSNLSDYELANLYDESRVYINAAYQEPFGMTSLESLGRGCKLVTVNDCGTVELKRYFPSQVIVCKRNPVSISRNIVKTIKSKKWEQPIMDKLTWQDTAKKIILALQI